jgi:putative membrane protein
MAEAKDPQTLFSAERTLLAWNRTSLALIAFGFLVERSGLLMRVLTPDRAESVAMQVTFWIGLAFIFIGALASVYSSMQFSGLLKNMNRAEFPHGYNTRWGMIINVIIALLGFVLAFALYISDK